MVCSIAVIGANAKTAAVQGGGSVQVLPAYKVSPLEGLKNRCGESIKISYEQGYKNYKFLPITDSAYLIPSGDKEKHGLTVEYFNNRDLSGEPVLRRVEKQIDHIWFGKFLPEVKPDEYSVRWSGQFITPVTGEFKILIGSSSRDIRTKGSFILEKDPSPD